MLVPNPPTNMALIATRRRGFSSNITPGLGSALSQGRAATISSSSGITPDFTEDFEGFQVGDSASGGQLDLQQLDPGSIRVSGNFTQSGSKSCLFAFKGLANAAFHTLQLDFNFVHEYSEMTCEYYLRIDSNYRHIDSFSSDNDKFFRVHALTGGTGQRPGYDTLGKLGCSTEYSGSSLTSNLASEWDTSNDTAGYTARGAGATGFLGPSDYGLWTKIKWYVKAATSLGGTGRAYLQLWKNDVLIINERPDNWDGTGASNRYGRGYFFGTRNTADGTNGTGTGAAEYDIYLDNVKFWVAGQIS
jgi:hypothetical protein